MAEKFRKFANAAAAMAVSLSRTNYFESGKKGELAELRKDLSSDITLLKKEAMKKVIAGMTIGKDVSPLFAEVLMCIQTDDLELKKLVYLYLMNYAKTQPELALLAINTFIKDSEDINPLIRALALRTMGCIRIERILDYVIEPLRKGIRDTSPYVRKTSALCIAKIFDLNPEVSEDCGFLEVLQELLMTDTNPMVISNVVAALADIQQLVPDLEALRLGDAVFARLVNILGDCTEWGQVFIMDCLADYDGSSAVDVEKMVEAVIPKLQHANQAVVMSAINLLIRQGMNSKCLPEDHLLRTVIERKLSSPLISVLSPPNPPEIQYAALRNVNLLVQAHPKLFGSEIGIFFCSYADPQYVKLEKLDIIGKIVDDSNIDRVLPELSEYAKDVDSEIVKKAISVLSRCALNAPRWSSGIREIFLELLETKLPIILQQVTINLVPLLRSECRADFFALLEIVHFVDLEEMADALYGDIESQAAFIWILGEFCSLQHFESEKLSELVLFFETVALSDSYKLEGLQFQTQVIICALKLFVNNYHNENDDTFDYRGLLESVLKKGLEESESEDLKDRCRFFEKCLSLCALKSKTIATSHREKVQEIDDWGMSAFAEDSTTKTQTADGEYLLAAMLQRENNFETCPGDENSKESSNQILEVLMGQLTKMSSIYHELPDAFVSARVVMKSDPDGTLSPLEQSLKSLSMSVESTSKAKEFVAGTDLPLAWTKLLRNNRPAVANLLNLEAEADLKEEAAEIVDKIAQVKSPKDRYANLLDLLD